MDICVLNYNEGYGKKFFELCSTLHLKEGITPEYLLKHGFTNYNEPTFYYHRGLNKKNYHISFDITIDKKTMEIKSIDLLNNEFLQPHMCNQFDYEQVAFFIRSLIKDGILEMEEAKDIVQNKKGKV